MDYNDPEKDIENQSSNTFEPLLGDHLLKIKTNSPDDVYLWRIIVTDKKIIKQWPIENDNIDCKHEDLYWGLDFKKRFITLCNDCERFAFGHKVRK
jgi:hypothetical protein